MSRFATLMTVAALVALLLVGSAGAIGGALWVADLEVPEDPETSTTHHGPRHWSDLSLGDCILLPDEEPDVIYDLTVVDCDSRHDAELYAKVELPGRFPGKDVAENQADAACHRALADHTGDTTTEPDYYYVYPVDARAWRDDSSIICFVLVDDTGTSDDGTHQQVGVAA